MTREQAIIDAIDQSPLNRGLSGSDWLANPHNVAIVSGDDIALFDGDGGDEFEVHFLYQSRGKEAILAGKEAFRRMFERTPAKLIFGLVPAIRPDVKFFARKLGGKHAGIRDTENGPCQLFVLSREMWGR